MSRLQSIVDQASSHLLEELPWLDGAFGLAQRIEREVNGKRHVAPGYYQADSAHPNDYLELLPDRKLGNYCFFWPLDPEKYEYVPRRPGIVHSPIALILWFHMRDVFDSSSIRDVESIKLEVLRALRSLYLANGRMFFNKIYSHGPNIFREFTLDEVDAQVLLHPYAGLRFEGEIVYDEPC